MIGKGAAIPEFIDRITEVAAGVRRARPRRAAGPAARRPPRRDRRSTASTTVYYEELVRKEQYDVDAQVVRTYFDFGRVRAGSARRDRPAVRPRPTPPSTTRRSGTPTWRRTTCRWPGEHARAASTSTCTRARASTSTPPSSRSPTASPAGSCPRACWCATSRGADGARRRRHAVPRVRPPRPPRARRPAPSGAGSPASPPSGTSSRRRASCSRSGPGTPASSQTFATQRRRRADPGRPGRGDEARRRLRQGLPARAPRCSTPRCPTGSTPTGPTTSPSATRRAAGAATRCSRYVDDTHMFAGFGHLDGYSSGYYTYMWSLVIAKDLFSAFDPDDLFDPDGRPPLPRPDPRPRRRPRRRRPGRGLPRPPLHLRRLRRLARAVRGPAFRFPRSTGEI